MNIAIIGAGWYGCHLALVLKRQGHTVRVFEAGESVLNRASINNQARLHAGFHYARCSVTRRQTIECFGRFIETYPTFSDPIENNIYAVSRTWSLMDATTYKLIMAADGAEFEEVDPADFGLVGMSGAIRTHERSLNFRAAVTYFDQALTGDIVYGAKVEKIEHTPDGVRVLGQKFDAVLNCTWCALDDGLFDTKHIYFEPTILFYYRAKAPFVGALTTVDGDCFSIYPYVGDVYTLSSVRHTRQGNFSTYAEAQRHLRAMNDKYLGAIRREMESLASSEFPAMPELFEYEDVQFSVKTKYDNAFASRDVNVLRRGRVISILSGKIDTIFVAEERVQGLLAEIESGVTVAAA